MIKYLMDSVLSLLFPRCCPVCQQIVMPKGHLICPDCFKLLVFVSQPVCKSCGKEVISEQDEYCGDCRRHPHSFDYGMALINYTELASRSMSAIKYKNKREYLDFYAAALYQRFGKQIASIKPDCLVPIPIHPDRRRKRGFNQAELLAKKLGKSLGIPVKSDLLIRKKKTDPQKNLNPGQRVKNLEEAFALGVNHPEIRSVLLVDDIYTTGSTIEACARILKKAGIKKIYFITICIGSER